MSDQLSIWHDNYLELRKKREDRIKLLQDHQKRVQRLEHHLFKIRNYLAKAVVERAQMQEKYEQLVQYDIWVTAEEHERIHLVRDKVEREYSEWVRRKKSRVCMIDEEAKKAKQHASHIIGIDRALVCLEELMRTHLLQEKEGQPELMKEIEAQTPPVFLRRFNSSYSFQSVNTANSKDSTSLSGALLKKWLEPRLQASQTHLQLAI
ncbi:hypothetical protein A0J61_00110 [Choanephora cucurbitarum]|uniref:Uncharacterized protein n=1 Tax=Choanephora cucurbitarum TaxID=101091 RepID=A0A1C7NT28_9FUNG|nr:hypothetical protein A0J61_00110 [Choanephora cucurbitarum]